MSIHQIEEALEIDPIEAAVMDVARAIQLTPTMHQNATQRYEALAEHVDRTGSPLEDQVLEVYPSGSFAIHAATRSRIKRDQHDVDAVLEMDIDANADPKLVLDTLYQAVKGESGSRYYDLQVEQNSRCVTVHYHDGVTVDLMPVVRLDGTPERVANLFHYKAETGETQHKIVNPSGFAGHFNQSVELNAEFARRFERRRFLVEGERYIDLRARMLNEDLRSLEERAETQPMPDFLPLDQKSPRVTAVQILKRFRDKRYRKHDDHRDLRKPPSVVIAALALNAPPMSTSLVDEVIAIATVMRDEIIRYARISEKIEVYNPACPNDLFTDRWPESLTTQTLWAEDLRHLVNALVELRRYGFDPIMVKTTFDDLFGESVSNLVLEDHSKAQNRATLQGQSRMTRSGSLVSPAMPSLAKRPSNLPRPAIIGVAGASGLITPARPNTNMGRHIRDDDH